MKRVLALLALAGCGDADCSLPAQIDEIVDGAPLRQCGDLPTMMGGQQPYEDARACVLAAAAEKKPFEVRWSVGADEAHALVGLYSGGYQLRRIDTDETRAETFECRAITDLGACGSIFMDLCLECTDATSTATCE